MLRQTILATALLIACTLSAQTFFYIEQIAVVPPDPTTSDQVSIQLTGYLSDTGAHVEVLGADVSGNMVAITLVANSDGGFTVLVPHTETVEMGQLPAGTYTIELSEATTGVLDMAPAEQHLFTVSGDGFPCNDLQVAVEWHAFSDTAIMVHAMHNTVEVFDYPNFILFDAQGDTLAIETVTFFGLAQDSWHVLRVVDGATIPNAFTGTLELWTGFTSTPACSWQHTFELCPPPPCATIFPTLTNMGGGIVLGSFNWSIMNADDEVAAGTFTLTDEVQSVQDTICVPPGPYLMDVSPVGPPTGGQPMYQVMAHGWQATPLWAVVWSLPVGLEFDVYQPCVTGTQGITGPGHQELTIGLTPGGLWVSAAHGVPLGSVQLIDAQGRLLFRTTANTDRLFVPVRTPGVYLVHAAGRTARVVAGVEQ